ncbi:UNKNOWN [Stylonychia lemnae]|uniref:Uncharacterized protein n=1 Tax=Stylonychia lemnae TaxID=5949 RepID=A0A078ATH9_STYLE|nr:UNKNOWN [Stylonychia lemnae]|eukprot:CDW84168.1 UNKNOWN [Stylonychia lemnae]
MSNNIMDKLKFPFRKSKQTSQTIAQPQKFQQLLKANPLHTIPEERRDNMNPQVKFLRPELVSGQVKLQQLGQKSLVKMFDKYFQEQFDHSMNKFEGHRKSMSMSMSMFEDYLRDQDSAEQAELGIILETIDVLQDSKQVLQENVIKDQLIGGNSGILSMVEGDIAKMVVREYENSQNMMKFICQENEQLKLQNSNLKNEVICLRRDIDNFKKVQQDQQDKIDKLNEIIEAQKNKINNAKMQKSEIQNMLQHESIVLIRRYKEFRFKKSGSNNDQELEEDMLNQTQLQSLEQSILEDNTCKQCRESLRQITQLQPFRVKINSQMISNSQSAMIKANDFINHYGSYLPDDYFDQDDDEDDQSNMSPDGQPFQRSMTLSGFFNKIKDSLSGTKTAADSRKTIQNGEQMNTQVDSVSSDHDSQDDGNLSFKSAEKVYEFMVDFDTSILALFGISRYPYKSYQQIESRKLVNAVKNVVWGLLVQTKSRQAKDALVGVMQCTDGVDKYQTRKIESREKSQVDGLRDF